jgi:hypothetical protein
MNTALSRYLAPSRRVAASALGSSQLTQTAAFSKYISKARAKRQPLTTKRAHKGFYKGNGARTEGKIDSRAHFKFVPEMKTELVMPDLSNTRLKAYVGPGAKRHIIDASVDVGKGTPF